MIPDIRAIFLDVGNTLRILHKDEPYQARARRRIASLTGATESPEDLGEKLDARYKTYRKWAFETSRETSERELWTRWLLPDCPAAQIEPQATELTRLFRESAGRREVQAGAPEVIAELDRRGYTLGIISNVITTREIPDWLAADGLAGYFKAVALSSVLGVRKPDPEIYRYATRTAGVEPCHSAYVGDNPKRDVVGTRAAGFGLVVLLMTPEELAEEPPTDETRPDHIIHQFADLLDLFPPLALSR